MDEPRPLLVASHGILTGQTSTSWPDALHVELANLAVVIKCEYSAGPLTLARLWPVWNHFITNPRLATARANEIELFHRAGYSKIHFVGHSNGTPINLLTIRKLARRGIPTHTMIATGSVLGTNVHRNGVLDLIEAGMLERAYAYCSWGDLPLRLPFAWPYRALGRRGWADVPQHLEDRIVTRWFPGYGHSGYFSDQNRARTFALIARDLGLGQNGISSSFSKSALSGFSV